MYVLRRLCFCVSFQIIIVIMLSGYLLILLIGYPDLQGQLFQF